MYVRRALCYCVVQVLQTTIMEFHLKDYCFNYDCKLEIDDLVRSLSLNTWAPFSKGTKCCKCNHLVRMIFRQTQLKISSWPSIPGKLEKVTVRIFY